jgi:hypothetical protein
MLWRLWACHPTASSICRRLRKMAALPYPSGQVILTPAAGSLPFFRNRVTSGAAATPRCGWPGASAPLEHVLEVSVRVVPVDACRVQQAHDGRGAFARAQAAGEQPVRPPQGNRPDVVLHPVVGDRHVAVVEELVAANFSRLSTASSCVSLSISACLKAVSRSRCAISTSLARSCSSRAASSPISDNIACRICGSRAFSCCALIMDSHVAAPTRRVHRHIPQLPPTLQVGFRSRG